MKDSGKQTAASLRAEFLAKAKNAMAFKLAQAGGASNELKELQVDRYFDPRHVEAVWEALVPMMQKESDARIIDAQNTSGIIKLLSEGKITIDECLKLMDILVQKGNVEMIDYTIKNPTNEVN